MKRCPKCNRTYRDDTLRFCLEDGARLAEASDSNPTVVRDADPPPTEIMYQRSAPTLKASGPTIPSTPDLFGAPREAPHRNPLLTGGVIAIAVLLLALVCIAGYFVLRQSPGTNSAEVNRSSSPAAKQDPTPIRGASPTAASDNSELRTNQGLKITASASSIRYGVQSNTYYADNAIDGKKSTAWIEGVDGPGLGEWIRFDFDHEVTLHRILIQPGYFKSPEIWKENNRLASATISFSDGSSRELTFTDLMQSQKFDVGSVKTKWVKLVIKSVYYGTDPDTAISEIAFEWES